MTLKYVLGLVVFFGLLLLLPRLVHQTRFRYTATFISSPKAAAFPLESAPVSLSDFAANHPGGLLINFWATWCPPCLEELPSLERLHRQLNAQNRPTLPKLVTFSVDNRMAEVHSLFKTLPFAPSFPVLHDPGAVFSRSLGTTRFPETYWVGPDGKVRHKWLGPQDWVSDAVLHRLAMP